MTGLLRLRSRGWAAVLLIMLAGGAAAIVPAAPAAAACWESGCAGLDPNVHCSATSVPAFANYHGSVPAYSLEMRYSSGCRSVWARARQDCFPVSPNARAYVRIQRMISSPYGWYPTHTYISSQVPCYGQWQWTAMVPNTTSDDLQRACLASEFSFADPYTFPESSWWLCTQWTAIA